jgi:arabinose-5-phosphate isomerase
MESVHLVQKLLNQQKKLVVQSMEQFDCAPLAELASELAACKGIVVLTGVGKSSFVAQKVSRTLVSCGIRAVYLSPLDALHGDLGMVSPGDWVIFISKSGESDELIQLAPFLKKRGVKMAAFVKLEKCRLASWVDLVIPTPIEAELGPLTPVPTTSTLLQLLYADLLAVAVLKVKGVSLDTFASNHPAGQIGKRLILTVDDFMLQGAMLPKARLEDKVCDVLVELSDKRCGCLLIVDEHDRLLGVFTDGDLRRSLQTHKGDCLDKTMQEVMTRRPRFVSKGLLAHEALEAMEANKAKPITIMPVLEGERVAGLIRLHDLLQAGI